MADLAWAGSGRRAPTHPVVLITGAAGFIGRHLSVRLLAEGWQVRGTVRAGREEMLPTGVEVVFVGDLAEHSSWECLKDVDAIVHLAARVPGGFATRREFRVNVDGMIRLAEAAKEAGVRRLIYVSSAKVHGEGSIAPYTERAPLLPGSPYAASKADAERRLAVIAGQADLETVILRPPIVYGPGVKGNFARLLRLVRRGIPIPARRTGPSRSLIYVGNLVDAIETCLLHPDAAGKTFLLRDGEDLAMSELVERLAVAMGRPARLFPLPLLSRLSRAACPLRVDDSLIRMTLGWQPPYSCREGLRRTAHWFLQEKR